MAHIEINKRTRKKIIQTKSVKMETMYRVLLILPISMLIFAFIRNTPLEIWEGTKAIFKANNALITDYLLIANTGAAFVNAAIVMLLNILLLYLLKLKPNGIIFATLFLLGGFSLMGKNPYNIWPFYIGGFVYSRYHHIPYKNVVVINMLSTALSPLNSFVIQSIPSSALLSIVLTALIGGAVGFIMPTVSSHITGTHSGYSLYNMGAATGFVGMLVYSVMAGFGLEVQRSSVYFEQFDGLLLTFFILYAFVLIGVGYYYNERSFKGYGGVLKHSGRLVTDIINQDGFGLSLINMGLLGFMGLAYIYLMGGVLNGPVIAGLLTVMGFGCFGKHPKNIWPIIVGVTLGFFFMGRQGTLSTLLISALFGTTLAPIAGAYGALWGILAGLLHAALVLNIGGSHGGLALYNNGLSGGIIAMLLIPMIDAFKREKNNET